MTRISDITIPLALKASPSGRQLVRARTNEPFFWMADTAWCLFHRCTREEATWYLDKRQAAGYNVVMAVILTEHDGLTTPNMYGEYLFHAGADEKRTDPNRINEKYFEHIDWIIEQAASRGITICLVPSWGKYFNGGWAGGGTVIWNEDNAYIFGKYVGHRYPGLPKIIGGDTNPFWFDTTTIWKHIFTSREDEVFQIETITDSRAAMQSMAQGVAKAEDKHGIDAFQTYHCTAAWLSNHPEATAAANFDEDWLKLDAVQTGHSTRKEIRTNPELEVWDASVPHIAIDKMWKAATISNPQIISDSVNRQAVRTGKRPVIDLEPHYEGMKDGLKGKNPHYFDENDIRNGTYSSVFAGACGLSYGANSIWQMYEPDKNLQPACALDPSTSWKQDLENLRGGQQLYILKDLFSSIDYEAFDSRIPSQESVLKGPREGAERITVTRDDGARNGRGSSTFMWAYSGTGEPFELDLSPFNGQKFRAEWVSPRDGQRTPIAEVFSRTHAFVPPSCGSLRDDWVLDIRLASSSSNGDIDELAGKICLDGK